MEERERKGGREGGRVGKEGERKIDWEKEKILTVVPDCIETIIYKNSEKEEFACWSCHLLTYRQQWDPHYHSVAMGS